MSANSNCYCTSVVIKVPGIQGTGIIWETLTDAEKQEISDRAISPIREYVEESKAEVTSKENNVISLANQIEADKNTTVDAKNVVVNLKDSVVNQITNTGQTWVNNVINEGNIQVTNVTDEGNTQVANISKEGNTQVEHLQAIIKAEESTLGVRSYEATFAISADMEDGSIITLPAPMYYFVGRDHLKISWNGLNLVKEVSYNEIGETDTKSTKFQITIPLKTGDVLNAWTIPLGRGTTDELIERIKLLEDAFAELSRVVVYRE